jgi:uncharacterized protein HemX
MVASLLTTSNIVFVLGIAGVVFAVFRYFKDPQIAADKKDALFAQQIKFEREATERRFSEIQNSFESLLTQSQNHIHTIDVKVETLDGSVSEMGRQLTRLATIIDERIPKKGG